MSFWRRWVGGWAKYMDEGGHVSGAKGEWEEVGRWVGSIHGRRWAGFGAKGEWEESERR